MLNSTIPHEDLFGMEIQLHPFLTSSLHGSEYWAYILTTPPRCTESSTTKQKAGRALTASADAVENGKI
jgi:hypothetical protein